MELNSLLFPAPNTKYTPEELEGEIMYVPRYYRFNTNHRKIVKVIDEEVQAQRMKNLSIQHRVVDEITIQNIVNRKDGAGHIESEEQLQFYKPRFANDPNMQQEMYDFYNRQQRQSSQLSEVQEETSPMRNLQQMEQMHASPESIEIENQAEKMRQKQMENEQKQKEQKKLRQKKFFKRYDHYRISHFIPCLYLPYAMGSSKLLIYFHANAEDIILSHELLDYLRALLRCNVLAMEYPGYGLYKEEHQNRYKYAKPVNPNIMRKYQQFKNIQMTRPKTNYAKDVREKRQQGVSDNYLLEDSMTMHDTDNSSIGFTFSCRPSYNTQVADGNNSIDPYEPYNENVFDSNEENILDDTEYLYDFLHQILGIDQENMIIFGRSMGSGPATHISSVRKPGALLLMSAFKSIRSVAQDQAGNLLKYLIQDRFDNITKIKNVKIPTFLVHGMKDNLIPFQHSKELHDACGGPCSIVLPSQMDHNDFDFCDDLITPFYHFLRQMNISMKEPLSAHSQMKIPQEYFVVPKAYLQKSVPMNWGCYCMTPGNLQAVPRISVNEQDVDGNPSCKLNQSSQSMSLQFESRENRGSHRQNYSDGGQVAGGQFASIQSIYGGNATPNRGIRSDQYEQVRQSHNGSMLAYQRESLKFQQETRDSIQKSQRKGDNWTAGKYLRLIL